MSEAMGNEETANQEAMGNGNNANQDKVASTRPGWIEQLPKDMQDDESLWVHQSIGDQIKASREEAKQWEGSVKVPGENATEEERNNFYKLLGKPDTAEAYQMGRPENLPKHIPYDSAIEADFRTFFHQQNLTEKQAASIWGKYHDLVASVDAERVKATEKALDSLKAEWKGDDYKINTEIAHRAFVKFSGSDKENQSQVENFLINTTVDGIRLGDHPTFLKLFANIGKATLDDNASIEGGSPSPGLSDEERARARFPNTKW